MIERELERRREEKEDRGWKEMTVNFTSPAHGTTLLVKRNNMSTGLSMTCSCLILTLFLSSLHQSIESMMGVQLSDDIGDWIMDGVMVCQVVNKLHPGTINTIHTTTEGQVIIHLSNPQYTTVVLGIPQ